MRRNIFDNMKMGIKLTGAFAFVFIFVTALMLTGAKVRLNALRLLDSKYSQYVMDIREIGDMKASLGKMRENIYQYISVPSARSKIQESI